MAESNGTNDVSTPDVSESEMLSEIVCKPCHGDGNNIEADGYCLDCCEHMCGECLKHHKKQSYSKHHKLLDKDNMPTKLDTTPVKDICTDKCKVHEDEIIKYYCPFHKFLGCSACVTLKHRICEDVEYIPEVSKDLGESQEYKEFQKKLADLTQKSEDIIKDTQENVKSVTEYSLKALQDFKLWRQEINEALNKLEKELIDKLHQIKKKDNEQMNKISERSKDILKDLQDITGSFNTLQAKKQNCQMFTVMKPVSSKITELQDKLKEMENQFISGYKFQPNVELQQQLKRPETLGTLFVRDPKEVRVRHVTDINVKSASNTKLCGISGSTLLSRDKLVITDYNNKKVKLIDLAHNEISSELETEEVLWDVTTINESQVAVTQPHSKNILILKCDYELVIEREFSVNGACLGIACGQDKLVVTFVKPSKVEVMDMTGTVLQSFVTDSLGDKLFGNPEYVAVSPDNQSIYVSDWDKESVTSLGMDGKVKAIYKDAELKRPCKPAVDQTGLLYLCGDDSSNIHLLTPQCTKVKILLKETDGLEDPESICYCQASGKLYIGMFDNDTIKVYQVS